LLTFYYRAAVRMCLDPQMDTRRVHDRRLPDLAPILDRIVASVDER
jgi:hypothetical protein